MVVFRPDYLTKARDILNCRYALRSDKSYVNNNLLRFSDRETVEAFETRKKLTPNPPDLRIAFNKLVHSIRARMGEVSRITELAEYLDAVNGLNGGVDGAGSSMDSFISKAILPELLISSVVGVFCSRATVPETLSEQPPYPKLTVVPYEDIINYVYEGNVLVKLILKSTEAIFKNGYPSGEKIIYEEYTLIDNAVNYTKYSDINTIAFSAAYEGLKSIPFAMISIEESPVYNALAAHNALLQISSSDFLFLNKSNYPIYTEQFDVAADIQLRQQQAAQQTRIVEEGKPKPGDKRDEIQIGTMSGRKYPKGTERPGFIAPPTEHLKVSEQKQERLREQIREILDVQALNVNSARQAADSKQQDKETLVGNVQALFDKLESLERQIATIWHDYYGSTSKIYIEYPKTFDLRTEATRLESAKNKLQMRDDIASIEARRLITIDAIKDILPRLSANQFKTIVNEIEKSPLHASLSHIVALLDKQGIHIEHAIQALGLSKDDASKVLAYNEERLKFITAIQMGGKLNGGPGSTGRPIENVGDEQ